MLITDHRSSNSMNRPVFPTKPANTRLIYYVLIFGFAMLLSSLWYIGNYSTAKLSELSLLAEERTQDYTNRLQLAIDLRSSTESVIAEARLYRTTRDLRVRGPATKAKLNEAKVYLEKLLARGKQLRANLGTTLPVDEREAWEAVEKSADAFWDALYLDERVPQVGPGTNQATAASGQAASRQAGGAESTPQVTDETQRQFFVSRTQLAEATRKLADNLSSRQHTVLQQMKIQQTQAAAEVNNRWWLMYMVSWIVAVATYVLAQRQVQQIREAKNNAQEAEGLTTSVLNSLSNDVLAFNEQGAVLTVNPAFLKDFKLQREECLQQDYRTLLSRNADLRSFVEQSAQEKNGHPAHRKHIQIPPASEQESTRLFDVDVAPRLVGEEQRGHVVVLTDVTEAERIREEANRNRTLSTVGQLTAQVAHEIYNPLGAIKLNVDLLEMQLGDEDNDVKHTVARLKRGLEHLTTIVMDLRYVTRPREPERQPTEMNALLDEVIELAGDRLERSRVVIKRVYDKAKLLGDYDPLQLRKVFLNLLINAVEASPREGEIELRTRLLKPEELPAGLPAERGAIAVSVVDHGTGMSPETKRRIFEAFYSTKQHGTGLGMMITQEIIKKHDGKIEIESEEGKGTTVSVYLPV
jgi:nitrogen-specific signal transduction histidine kinase